MQYVNFIHYTLSLTIQLIQFNIACFFCFKFGLVFALHFNDEKRLVPDFTLICSPLCRMGSLLYMLHPSAATLTWSACYWTEDLRLTLKRGQVSRPSSESYIFPSVLFL